MKVEPKLREILNLNQFPLSSKYDIEWVCENEMGPSALWLAEFLAEKMNLKEGMGVLDLGCGKAISSIFLAKEYNVKVWALDWWVSPVANKRRIECANMAQRVTPIRAECHNIPFRKNFFDAIISLDSYQYYGTDEMYFPYILNYLKPGGRLGIVVPSVYEEINDTMREKLKPYWEPYLYTHHSPTWWKTLWEHWDIANVVCADYMQNGYYNWLLWDKALSEAGVLKRTGDVELLQKDGGNFTFARIIARKNKNEI